jgi:Putative peptidoglycan binding domain
MAGEPTLRHRDQETDGWVKYLQQLLVLTEPSLEESGIFDDDTFLAVQKFQRAHGLLDDGVVGDQTWAALRFDPAHAPATDGLAPGTHVETGPRAEWYSDYGQGTYDEATDSAGAFLVNVGGVPLAAGGTAPAAITKADGSNVARDAAIEASDGDPAQPGQNLFAKLGDLRAALGAGTHTIELTLPAEWSGQRTSFRITIP